MYFIEEKREEAIPLLVAKIQAYYRGMLARRYVKKLRAQLKISRWWRAFKAVKYMNAVTAAFKFPADDRCKTAQWPSPPMGISDALETLGRRLHTMWWTQAVLKKFSQEKKAEIATKMTAYTLLKGKRAQWGCGLEWKGNYMASTPNAEKYGTAVLALITKHQDGKVAFASEVLLLNMKKKEEEKVLVVTEKNIYVLDAKKFKMATKVPYDLATVTGLAVSTGEDQLTVIKIPGGTDLVVKLVGDAVSAELITAVINGCGKTLPVQVADSLSVTLKGGETTLTLEEAEAKATKFAASKEGVTLINRKQSIIRQQVRDLCNPCFFCLLGRKRSLFCQGERWCIIIDTPVLFLQHPIGTARCPCALRWRESNPARATIPRGYKKNFRRLVSISPRFCKGRGKRGGTRSSDLAFFAFGEWAKRGAAQNC